MDKIWATIKSIAEDSNGFLKTGQIEKMGISRPMLRKLRTMGMREATRGREVVGAHLRLRPQIISVTTAVNKASQGMGILLAAYVVSAGMRKPEDHARVPPQGGRMPAFYHPGHPVASPRLRTHYFQ